MTINIQYQNMPESESLNQIVSDKLDKLFKKYGWLIKAEVLFKLENHRNDRSKCCEIKLSCPGPFIFAKSIENDFEKSAAETIQDLKRQLQKRKGQFIKH
ncbi:MAG: ribosome-associated translation inhibitor RaiA [Croceitalea sp.]|nr:ribosome-associated translation inhibitor RaiA [Croceitalea sp.]NNL09433.1 ribosome-associated translation inhibitor RaiA [Croceitalea sp.]NNM17340.1 ribosome-associated translation inhibitor RaiA [Croceitalea sp.]